MIPTEILERKSIEDRQKVTVQAPFIDERTIKRRCEIIASMHQNGGKGLFNPMLGEVEKVKYGEIIEETYGQLQEEK